MDTVSVNRFRNGRFRQGKVAMREDTRTVRQDQIEQAAYAVLEENGYAGTSMLAIARRARASNETLYNWYGDKTGLFRALVQRNTAEVRALLEAQIAGGGDPIAALDRLGPVLLSLLTGARAVALNRAAAADPSGELGRAILHDGRDTVAPLIAQVMAQARDAGQLGFDDLNTACDGYLSLLVGDLQIRRVVGRIEQPPPEALAARSAAALRQLRRLFPPSR